MAKYGLLASWWRAVDCTLFHLARHDSLMRGLRGPKLLHVGLGDSSLWLYKWDKPKFSLGNLLTTSRRYIWGRIKTGWRSSSASPHVCRMTGVCSPSWPRPDRSSIRKVHSLGLTCSPCRLTEISHGPRTNHGVITCVVNQLFLRLAGRRHEFANRSRGIQ